ncbi:MAG: hypothetical protein QW491_13300 [Thermoproteota archaeon]
MIRPSKLRYVGIVLLMTGLGISILTILRGLSPYVFATRVGIPENSTFPLFLPPIWPPRNVRIVTSLNSREISILIFDKHNYELFMETGNAVPLKEFEEVSFVNLEIPARGEYYVVLRNKGAMSVEGEIILMFWGFERDLAWLSIALAILGAMFLVYARFLTLGPKSV